MPDDDGDIDAAHIEELTQAFRVMSTLAKHMLDSHEVDVPVAITACEIFRAAEREARLLLVDD